MDKSQNSLLEASGSDSGADSAELVRIASHVDSPDNTQLDMETENNATKSEGTLWSYAFDDQHVHTSSKPNNSTCKQYNHKVLSVKTHLKDANHSKNVCQIKLLLNAQNGGMNLQAKIRRPLSLLCKPILKFYENTAFCKIICNSNFQCVTAEEV